MGLSKECHTDKCTAAADFNVADPDSGQNFMDPQHWEFINTTACGGTLANCNTAVAVGVTAADI